MKTHLIVVTLILSLNIQAQDSIKTWRDGALTWKDFKVKKVEGKPYVFSYHLGYNSKKIKQEKMMVKQIIAESYLKKNKSYIDPDFKTEKKLKYLQVLFNIVEIHRRIMQSKLNNVDDLVELTSIYNETNLECEKEILRFNQISNNGEIETVVNAWQEETLQQITDLPDNKLPEIEKYGFGFGMHGGFGSSLFAGGLQDYFGPSFNLGFGFELGYNRHKIFIEGLLGFTRIKQDYLEEGKWLEGNRANISVIDLAYGYSILDNKKIKITTFAGLGITDFTTEHENEVQEDYRFVDYNIAFGLQTDINIRRRLNLIPKSAVNLRDYNESSIKLRLFMTRAQLNEDISGSTINLGIEYAIFERFF